MPGSRVNLGMGQPGRKKAKGTAVKKAKGGSMMKPKPKPPGMKGGGEVEDPTLPDGKFRNGGGVRKRNRKKIVPDESGSRRLKPPPNPGAAKLPKTVRNKMGFMNQGGAAKKAKGASMMKPPPKMTKGGSVYKKGKKSGPKP